MTKSGYGVLLRFLLLGAVLVTGCSGEESVLQTEAGNTGEESTVQAEAGNTGEESTVQAEDGNTVSVHYTGTLADGTVFDTSVGREPLEFTIGEGNMLPGFEQAVKGMRVGESKTVTIPSEEAYGLPRDDLVAVLERSQLPEDLDPEVGQQLINGTTIVTVIAVSETTITIDANHPLAGKDLTFEIELVEIK